MPYHARALKLDRMAELLDRLHNPQRHLPVVHIAGTKGKGSTAVMVAEMLGHAGFLCGLYTSPHLERIEERMVVGGQTCSEQEFVDLVTHIKPVVEDMDRRSTKCTPAIPGPTYFEILTAMALLYFASRHVDVAVLETGLGGRLDSTNLCEPLVSVITTISFDHMEQLGHTLTAIAGEKAGIIKPGVPVISGVTQGEPLSVIRQKAAETGSDVYSLGRDFHFTHRPAKRGSYAYGTYYLGGQIDYWQQTGLPALRWDAIDVALFGQHQGHNAATALCVASLLRQKGWKIAERDCRVALSRVQLPVRVELVSHDPPVIVDAAHNVASIEALVAALNDIFPRRPRILLFASTRGKEYDKMLASLVPEFDQIILTRYQNNPRAVTLDKLNTVLSEILERQSDRDLPVTLSDSPTDAFDKACELSGGTHLICATGSFFISSEIRSIALNSLWS